MDVSRLHPSFVCFSVIPGRLGSVRAVGSLYDDAPVADISTVATWWGPPAHHSFCALSLLL